MSLFQCQHCGCKENTALSEQGFVWATEYDWTGIEERKGMKLCSACGPAKYKDGSAVEDGGKWHGRFPRVFLEKGEYRTNKVGSLERIPKPMLEG